MKLISLLLFASLLVFQATAQTDIPQAVTKAFQTKFPTAQSVKWEEEDKGVYEAGFKQNGRKMSASFDATGNWQATETAIKKSALPDAVRSAVAKLFPGFEIDEAEKVESPDGLAFEVELENESGDKEVEVEALFSAEGKLLKKSEAAEEEEEDD